MGGSFDFGDLFDRVQDTYGQYLDYQKTNKLINSFGTVNGRRITGMGPNGEYIYGSSTDFSSLLPILIVGAVVVGGVVLLSRA